MLTVNVKQLMEAIHDQEAYADSVMNDSTSYLFDNVQRKLERNLSVRISDLDYDAFDLEDVDALADLYNERDERCCAVVTTSDNVRRMKPVAAASSYC